MDSSKKYDDDKIALMYAEALRLLKQREELEDTEFKVYEEVPKHELKDEELAVYRKVK